MKKIILIFLLTIICFNARAFSEEDVPIFQVIANIEGALSILVPESTTEKQLEALLFKIRSERQNRTLQRLVPGIDDKYYTKPNAVIWIFIFSDPNWATEDKLNRYLFGNYRDVNEKRFRKEYNEHVKAEYHYWRSPVETSSLSKRENTPTETERGNIGVHFFDEKFKSPNYRKVF